MGHSQRVSRVLRTVSAYISRFLHGKCARIIFIHEFSSIRKRTSEFSNTKQRVNKNRTKHKAFAML